MIDVVRLPKLRVLSPLHWTTTYAYLRSDDAVPLWYILAVEIAIILVTGFIIMKNRRHTHLTLLSQAYRTFAEGREDLENGKFDRNTGCRKKVRGTDGSGPCEPFCHTRKIYGIIGRNGSGKTVLLKASVVLSCRMRGNPGSWQTGGEGCGYPTGNWNYY